MALAVEWDQAHQRSEPYGCTRPRTRLRCQNELTPEMTVIILRERCSLERFPRGSKADDHGHILMIVGKDSADLIYTIVSTYAFYFWVFREQCHYIETWNTHGPGRPGTGTRTKRDLDLSQNHLRESFQLDFARHPKFTHKLPSMGHIGSLHNMPNAHTPTTEKT